MKNYSHSKYPVCQSTLFEIVDETPTGSKYVLSFVRCSSCKTVVGVLDYYNLGDMMHKMAEKLRINLDN